MQRWRLIGSVTLVLVLLGARLAQCAAAGKKRRGRAARTSAAAEKRSRHLKQRPRKLRRDAASCCDDEFSGRWGYWVQILRVLER